MSTLKIVTIAIISLGLAGCNHYQKHPHYGGDFCPPGQAKKGNC